LELLKIEAAVAKEQRIRSNETDWVYGALWLRRNLKRYQEHGSGLGGLDDDGASFFKRVSAIMCKQVSVSLPYRGDSHDDQYDNYTGTAGSTAC
jgi:hypothetical protein